MRYSEGLDARGVTDLAISVRSRGNKDQSGLSYHLQIQRNLCACEHTVLPLCFLSFVLPREPYLSGRYWPCRSLSLWVKRSQLWQCRRGVNAKIDSLKDFHLQWKIEYKSGFIGNNYKKVVFR